MLILTRKVGESIVIGVGEDEITVVVTRAANGSAKIGIQAPDDVLIRRNELDPREVAVEESLALAVADVAKAIKWRTEFKLRCPTYNVPLPRVQHPGGELHVGCSVRVEGGNSYTVVGFSGAWAILVPLNNAQCAYVARIDELTVVDPLLA